MSTSQVTRADRPLGYSNFAGGVVDTVTVMTALTFGAAAGAGIPSGTQTLRLTPNTQAIRWRDDGVAPTATVGYPLAAGQELVYTGNPNALQVISQLAGAKIDVVAYG
jgi:hypothetical protein